MSTETISKPSDSFVVSAEADVAWTDTGIALLIVVLALVYLYHKLWRKRGACSHCGSKNGSCCAKPNPDKVTRIPIDQIKRPSR
jgi:hypothetical protein